MVTADFIGPDGQARCHWCGGAPEFLAYHDQEWGFPVKDDQRLFEKLCLESFQSGLSWRTILNKRQHFREAFDHFDFHRVAQYREADVQRLLGNSGIIRHRGKIEAVINNARCALALIEEAGSLASFFWAYEPDPADLPPPQSQSQSDLSRQLARALKQRGWRFVGPTTVYSFLQAMGMINDHSEGCVTRAQVEQARDQWQRPSLAPI